MVTAPLAQYRECNRGAYVDLSITATGPTPLRYQWRRNGLPIANVGGRITGATTASLRIGPMAIPYLGSYDCLVSGPCEPSSSGTISLNVCLADVNCTRGISTDDLFAFLGGYFAGNLLADLSGDGIIGVEDLLDYVSVFLTGCN